MDSWDLGPIPRVAASAATRRTATGFERPWRARRVAAAAAMALSAALCFWLDHVWGEHLAGFFGWATYLFAAVGLCAYVASLAELPSGPTRHLVTGAVLAGGLGAAMIGLILLPFTLLGLFFLVGALGFAPFAVSTVLMKRFRELMRDGDGPRRPSEHVLVGAAAAATFGLAVLVNRVENRWLDRRFAEAAASEDAVAAGAIDRLAVYPICRRGCLAALCGPEVLDRPGPEVRAALTRALGEEPRRACERILD